MRRSSVTLLKPAARSTANGANLTAFIQSPAITPETSKAPGLGHAPDATITILGGDTEADVAPRPNGNNGQVNNDDINQIRRFAAGFDTNYLYNELQRADVAPLADEKAMARCR